MLQDAWFRQERLSLEYMYWIKHEAGSVQVNSTSEEDYIQFKDKYKWNGMFVEDYTQNKSNVVNVGAYC